MRAWVAGLLLTVLALSGCTGCQPLLEVRHCLLGKCDPSPDAIQVDWTDQHARDWPDVHALMLKTEEGSHEHLEWDRDREQAFWDAFGATGPERELIVLLDGERYRVRVLTCD